MQNDSAVAVALKELTPEQIAEREKFFSTTEQTVFDAGNVISLSAPRTIWGYKTFISEKDGSETSKLVELTTMNKPCSPNTWEEALRQEQLLPDIQLAGQNVLREQYRQEFGVEHPNPRKLWSLDRSEIKFPKLVSPEGDFQVLTELAEG